MAYFRKILAKVKSKPTEKNKGKPNSKPQGKQRERHDWPVLKTEFTTGNFPSLSAFARSKGISPTSAYFRRMTAGWRKDRDNLQIISEAKTQEKLVDGKAAEKYQDIYTHALVIQIQLFELLQYLAHSTSTWGPITGPADALEGAKFIHEMQRVLEKILPGIRGLQMLHEVNHLFDQLAEEKIDITKAAIEFMRLGINLPKPMEIMLARHQPAEPEPDDADLITDEQILARRQELMAEIEQERVEVVADRQKYVADLKKQMKAAGGDAWGDLPDDEKRTIN